MIEAGGAFNSINQVIIRGTSFPNLTPKQAKAAPNAAADVAELQKNIADARAHSLTWVNDLAPDITNLPQAFINAGTFAATWQPKAATLSHEEILRILGRQSDLLGAQAKTLIDLAAGVLGLQQKISIDAQNFSDKHAAFAELEQLDSASLTAMKAALDKITALIAQESNTINVDLTKAGQNFDTASAVMEAGEKAKGEAGEIVKMAAVIIGVVLIIIADKEIEEALANIQQRLANAQKQEQYQINFTELTLQLVALQTAKNALASLSSEVADVHKVLTDAAQWFLDRQSDLKAIIAAGAPSSEVNDISLKTYANSWQTLQTAGTNWQLMEAGKPDTTHIKLAGFSAKP